MVRMTLPASTANVSNFMDILDFDYIISKQLLISLGKSYSKGLNYAVVSEHFSFWAFVTFLQFCKIINITFISADTPLAQVKLGEVGAWLGRRNKSPQAIVGAVSRGN